jgi:hypothetical protein
VGELIRRMTENSARRAIVYEGVTYLYGDLLELKASADKFLRANFVFAWCFV